MKKLCSLILVLCLIFSLSACNNNSQEKMIKDAIDNLKFEWRERYYISKTENDGYFEIKNTRVIKFKDNDVDLFENVNYIIEFVLFTDNYGLAPYYSCAQNSNSVIVYKDGSLDVLQANLLLEYTATRGVYDYSNIVESVKDYGEKYNCVEILK